MNIRSASAVALLVALLACISFAEENPHLDDAVVVESVDSDNMIGVTAETEKKTKKKPKWNYDYSFNGYTLDTYDFKVLPSSEITALEKQVGATPVIPQTMVPPSPVNPKFKGKPGPSPAMGSNDAPVKVFLFSDFQCPNCRRVVEPMKYLVRKFPNDVQVIFKQYPLPSHKKAFDAALAATAAGRQNKFWEYHDLLFQNMQRLDRSDLFDYARKTGLDMERFTKDFESKNVRQQVEYERSLAEALEINGTPGFIISGQKVVGWASYDYVERLALNGKKNPGKCQVDGIDC